MKPDSPFNVVLAEARIARGMTIKQVAEAGGFTVGFVRSYEEVAINPTAQTLYFFAIALGLSVTINRNGVSIEGGDGAILLRDWIPNRREGELHG